MLFLWPSVDPATWFWSGYNLFEIKQCLFSRASCHVEYVIACLKPKYMTEIESLDGTTENLDEEYVNYQKNIIFINKDGTVKGLLPTILRKMFRRKESTAADFLEFATGTRGVPYNDPEFKVTIEFSAAGAAKEIDALPRSHTCTKVRGSDPLCLGPCITSYSGAIFQLSTNHIHTAFLLFCQEVVLPYTAYFGSAKTLKKKLLQSLRYSFGFDCDAYGDELYDE